MNAAAAVLPVPAKPDLLVPTRRVMQHERLNDIALLAMNSTTVGLQKFRDKFAPTYERRVVELLSILIVDVTTDVEVSARESKVSDASFVRLRRAMDRVACAQSVLETMRAESAGASGETAKCAGVEVRMREAGSGGVADKGVAGGLSGRGGGVVAA